MPKSMDWDSNNNSQKDARKPVALERAYSKIEKAFTRQEIELIETLAKLHTKNIDKKNVFNTLIRRTEDNLIWVVIPTKNQKEAEQITNILEKVTEETIDIKIAGNNSNVKIKINPEDLADLFDTYQKPLQEKYNVSLQALTALEKQELDRAPHYITKAMDYSGLSSQQNFSAIIKSKIAEIENEPKQRGGK